MSEIIHCAEFWLYFKKKYLENFLISRSYNCVTLTSIFKSKYRLQNFDYFDTRNAEA